jgi:hypothetical protein
MKTDPKLSEAIARLNVAQAEVDKWSTFIRLYQELDPSSTGAAGVMSPIKQETLPPNAMHRRETETSSRLGQKGLMTEQAAIAVLKEAGQPVSTEEMAERLRERGVDIGGRDPISTLYARLRRARALDYDRRFGWRLVEPRQEIGTAGPPSADEPAASEIAPISSPVEPAAGGGT